MAQSVLGKINYLTEEQYQKAKSEGKINPDEIYMTPDDIICFDEPTVLHSGDTKDSITLYDSCANYTRIDILGRAGAYPFVKTLYIDQLNSAQTVEIPVGGAWHDGTSGGGIFMSFYTLSGKSLTYVTSARFYTYSGQGAIFNTTNSVIINKIIGYKTKVPTKPDNVNKYDNTIYSTSEMVVGTWVNGKPLYRKVFNTISVSANNSSSTAHGISNLDAVARYTAHSYLNGVIRPVTYTNGSKYVLCEIDKNNINIYNTTDNPYTITVIMEYTKTTD